MAVVGGVEVDLVDLVDDLAQQRAVLHVVVGTVERAPDQDGDWVATAEGLELGDQRQVDEAQELVASDAFGIGRPVAPAKAFGQGGLVVVLHDLELALTVIEDLQEEDPSQLGQALGVTIDAGVLAHGVLDGLDDI